jgi:excinuclease ABC subunit B
MLAAAEDLRFEYAARLRDELRDLRRAMRELSTTDVAS